MQVQVYYNTKTNTNERGFIMKANKFNFYYCNNKLEAYVYDDKLCFSANLIRSLLRDIKVTDYNYINAKEDAFSSVYIVETKEVGKMVRDSNEFGKDKVIDMIKNAYFIAKRNLLIGVKDYEEKVKHLAVIETDDSYNEAMSIFDNEEFGKLEVFVDEDEKIYFPATECARILEYENPQKAVRNHCNDKGVLKRAYLENTGFGEFEQEKKYINEGNLYRLIVGAASQSKNLEVKAKAEKFETWIFDDVLPSIRKNGMYMRKELLEKNKQLIQIAKATIEMNDNLKNKQFEDFFSVDAY